MDQQLLKLRLKSLCSISSIKGKENDNCFRNAFHGTLLEQWQLVEFPFLSKLSRYVYRYSSVPVPVKDRTGKLRCFTIYNKNNNAGFILSLWFKVPLDGNMSQNH
jgi:hypothetical protein